MEDNNQVWPPAPNASVTAGGSDPSKKPKPYLAVILVMWASTIGQFFLQSVMGLDLFGKLFGFSGFVLAVFLVTRQEKAARINGGLRLGLWFLGFVFHLLNSRSDFSPNAP